MVCCWDQRHSGVSTSCMCVVSVCVFVCVFVTVLSHLGNILPYLLRSHQRVLSVAGKYAHTCLIIHCRQVCTHMSNYSLQASIHTRLIIRCRQVCTHMSNHSLQASTLWSLCRLWLPSVVQLRLSLITKVRACVVVLIQSFIAVACLSRFDSIRYCSLL
jgi:hypothetical protein